MCTIYSDVTGSICRGFVVPEYLIVKNHSRSHAYVFYSTILSKFWRKFRPIK